MDVLVLESVCRLAVGVLFAISAIGKLRSRHAFGAFESEVRGMKVLPARWVRPAALAVCLLEAAVVASMAASATAPAGMAVAGVLLTTFSVAITSARRNGTDARCHCFGFRSGRFGRRHVLRNLALTAMCAAGVVAALTTPDGRLGVAGQASATAVAGVIVVATVFLDDVAFLLSPGPGRR
ncbi:MauE/DoxX family redox-associated membrane protein [Micromonospora coxensis]|uniref:MauE/DoxX family redox-associated membrane protein n=1 Tax=Micromonospora coxensis TaxID=356852 RepID=UPI00341205A3